MKRLVIPSVSVLLFVALMIFTAVPVFAGDITVTLKPGESTTIPARFWCLEYGKDYPTSVIPGTAERAPDGVIAVLETAIAKGTILTNPYQTQLAIWRVTNEKFNDYGEKGTVLAEEIYAESLNYTVQGVTAGQETLTSLTASGVLSVTVADFTAQKDEMNPGLTGPDFFGKGSLVITNVSQQTVTFIVQQGGVFTPPEGMSAQSVVSQYDVPKPPKAPETGGDLQSQTGTTALLAGVGGMLSIALAVKVLRARKPLNA